MIEKLRVALVIHPDLVPGVLNLNISEAERRSVPWITEWDVMNALTRLGHKVLVYAVHSKSCLLKIVKDRENFDLVFNLLEQVGEEPSEDYILPKILEKNKIPYTGCNWKELRLGKDKLETKKKVKSIGVSVAENINLGCPVFPLILKFNEEDGSYGIFKANIIHNKEALRKRINFLKNKYGGDLFAEEFLKGKEVYVSISKNNCSELDIPHARELCFLKSKNPDLEIYTEKAKWSYKYQKSKNIFTRKLGDDILNRRVIEEAKRIYNGLQLTGPVRIDFRCNNTGIYFLELNPNPNLAFDDDFFLSRGSTLNSYDMMISSLVQMAFYRYENYFEVA